MANSYYSYSHFNFQNEYAIQKTEKVGLEHTLY